MHFNDAIEIIRGLSAPSAMPGYGYSLPALECKTGSRLYKIKGSICSGCYARRGNYSYPLVRNKLYERFAAIKDPRWVEAMTTAINTIGETFFRWHDSGDIQSLRHLTKIVEVCKRTPKVKHWLPTKETKLVKRWQAKYGALPKNLCIRHSAHMIDEVPSESIGSMVYKNTPPPDNAFICTKRERGNRCGLCRACWDPSVKLVAYSKH